MGIENFKEIYPNYLDFAKPYQFFNDFTNHFHHEFSHFTLQEVLLFKGNQLCVPRGSIRENLIQENHNDALSRDVKRFDQRFYYWPTLSRDVKSYVERCMVCQKSK